MTISFLVPLNYQDGFYNKLVTLNISFNFSTYPPPGLC